MSRHDRRRNTDQRNLLYHEPSMLAALVTIAIIAVVVAVILVFVFGDVFASGR